MSSDCQTPKSGPRVLIFTGDGKGKTTAALGMALRAAGHGQRVFIIQFIKADSSVGEITALQRMPRSLSEYRDRPPTFRSRSSVFRQAPSIEIIQTGRGFLPPSTHPSFAEHREMAERGLRLAMEAIDSGGYNMVILDEICVAVAKGLLNEEDVVRAISTDRPITLVLTGRSAGERLIAVADTVSEVCCIKHGLKDGWKKQKGVEY